MARDSKVYQFMFVHYPFTAVRVARLTTHTDALGHGVYEKSYRLDKKRLGRLGKVMRFFENELPVAGLIYYTDPGKFKLGEASDGKGD